MIKTDDPIEKLPEVLTVARAAEVAGRSRRTMRRWVRLGMVTAYQPNGVSGFYVNTRSLLRLLGVEGV